MKPRILEFDGLAQPISEWALDYGITSNVIIVRLSKGWSIEAAITTPMRAKPGEKLPAPKAAKALKPQVPKTPKALMNRRYAHDGLNLTIKEWAERTGIRAATLCYRLRTGLPIKDALSFPHSYKPAYVRSPVKPHHHAKLFPFNGGTITVPEIVEQTGAPASTVRRRLASGWTVERIVAASLEPATGLKA